MRGEFQRVLHRRRKGVRGKRSGHVRRIYAYTYLKGKSAPALETSAGGYFHFNDNINIKVAIFTRFPQSVKGYRKTRGIYMLTDFVEDVKMLT